MANEKRLIDANELAPCLWALFKYFGSIPCSEADKATQRGIKRCIGEIKKMPTVDAVEVVRCKDCKFNNRSRALRGSGAWCDYWWIDPNLDDFCSYGERKDNES